MTSEGTSGLYEWVWNDPDFPVHEPDFENMKDITPQERGPELLEEDTPND